MFWIAAQVLTRWEELGGITGAMGFPMSNVYVLADGSLRQDFAFGYMFVPRELVSAATEGDSSVIEVVPVDDPGAALVPLGDVRGKILGQPTVTSWFVDGAGVRHWIADGPTWECLGGQANVASEDIPGYAIWTLPLGAPATCPPG
jgi:hypothetical protein